MSYNYVPAGALQGVLGNLSMYVCYERNAPDKVTVQTIQPRQARALLIRAPDRTIIVSNHYRPMPENVDEAICLDPYKKGSIWDPWLKYTLISSHNAMGSGREQHRENITRDVTTILDSGGAQVKIGVERFVDPRNLFPYMNNVGGNNKGLCVSLDIPPRPSDAHFDGVVEALARIQHKNNQVYKRYAGEGFRMLNAIHGFTLDQERRWAEEVADNWAYGWASASNNYTSLLTEIRCILVPLLEFPEVSNNHYHLFGISGKLMFPVLAWLGKYHPNITSDSSSWIQTAVMKKMTILTPNEVMLWDFNGEIALDRSTERRRERVGGMGAMPDEMEIGRRGHYEGVYNHIPCSCPICSRLKYLDIFRVGQQSRIQYLAALHNLWQAQQLARYWNNCAQTMDMKQYVERIKRHMPTASARDSAVLGVHYIEQCMSQSIDYAERNFGPHLGNDPGVGLPMGEALFDDYNEPSVISGDVEKKSFTAIRGYDSNLRTTLSHYLTRAEIEEFGLEYYPPLWQLEKMQKTTYRQGVSQYIFEKQKAIHVPESIRVAIGRYIFRKGEFAFDFASGQLDILIPEDPSWIGETVEVIVRGDTPRTEESVIRVFEGCWPVLSDDVQATTVVSDDPSKEVDEGATSEQDPDAEMDASLTLLTEDEITGDGSEVLEDATA